MRFSYSDNEVFNDAFAGAIVENKQLSEADTFANCSPFIEVTHAGATNLYSSQKRN